MRAQEIPGHADVRTTLAMRRKHDDSADKMAQLAGLTNLGSKWETNGSVGSEETKLSDCFSAPCEGTVFQRGTGPARQLSLQPVAIGAVAEVTKRLKPSV